MTTAHPDRAYYARRAAQEAVLAMQAPPGAARGAPRAMCVSDSRRGGGGRRPAA